MLLNVAVFFLFALDVLAVPFTSDTRVSRRHLVMNKHNPGGPSGGSSSAYSFNWAGAMWAKNTGTFSFITGTFTVPTPSGSVGASAAAWVGIDGDTCNTAIIQTGISFAVSSNGPTYSAWYEWYPAASGDFTSITVSAGDVVRLNVTAYTRLSGTVTIENLTNGQTVSQDLTSNVPLCLQDAEWIVEDYREGSTTVPFANFGMVDFTDAMAIGDTNYYPQGAFIWDIDQYGHVLTSTSTSGSSVVISYV